jgi:hypothetical protein
MTRAYTATRATLARLRLAAQGLDSSAAPTEVVRTLLAVQAQDYPAALWGIGLRSGSTQVEVEAALGNRELVRSWPMRGTLHIVPAEDLGWMLHLTRERTLRSAAGRHRQLELDDETFARAAAAAEAAVAAGPLARPALLAALEAAGISVQAQRGSHLLFYLCLTGLLVFGPKQGAQHSFTLLRDWVEQGRALDGDEALAEFARRYYTGHGPATDRDFAWWSSLTLTDARRGLAMVADELERFSVDGVEYWHRPGLEPAPAGVLALPGFDEYLLGYQNRGAQLAPEWAGRIVPGGNGMFLPMVVVDGEVVGTWKRAGASVTVDAFAPISASTRRSLLREFERYAEHLGVELQVVV